MLKYLFPLMLAVSPAMASEAVNFATPLHDLTGVAQDCDAVDAAGKCDKLIPLTLGRFCAEALSQPAKGALVADSIRRGALAARVFKEETFSLTADEVQLIEKAIPELQVRPAVVLDAMKLLDPALVANTTK